MGGGGGSRDYTANFGGLTFLIRNFHYFFHVLVNTHNFPRTEKLSGKFQSKLWIVFSC